MALSAELKTTIRNEIVAALNMLQDPKILQKNKILQHRESVTDVDELAAFIEEVINEYTPLHTFEDDPDDDDEFYEDGDDDWDL